MSGFVELETSGEVTQDSVILVQKLTGLEFQDKSRHFTMKVRGNSHRLCKEHQAAKELAERGLFRKSWHQQTKVFRLDDLSRGSIDCPASYHHRQDSGHHHRTGSTSQGALVSFVVDLAQEARIEISGGELVVNPINLSIFGTDSSR
jgi:hypothetical protein